MAAVVLALATALPQRASAVELHIHFGALERILSAQIFTEEGRKYVRGDKTNKCNFAYLEKPEIKGQNGKLEIKARFTGRTSVGVFGHCVGMGDAFDVIITAVPHFREGAISFRDVAAAPHNSGGFYARSVCSALASSLEREFRYPLASEAKKALEDPGAQPGFRRELRKFQVPAIRVSEEALVLHVDFELSIQ